MKKLFCLLLLVVFLPVVSFAVDYSSDFCGKWSFYWDLRTLPHELQDVMSASVMSYELYIFPDGSAHMTSMSMDKNDKLDFSYGALSGVWLNNDDNLVIRIGKQTYKAVYHDDVLNVYFTDKIYFPFTHINQSDFMNQQAMN